MGLISRVSSRTYRINVTFAELTPPPTPLRSNTRLVHNALDFSNTHTNEQRTRATAFTRLLNSEQKKRDISNHRLLLSTLSHRHTRSEIRIEKKGLTRKSR